MYFASDLKKTGADETVNFSSNRGGGALTEDGTAGHRKRRTPQDSVGDCGPSSASVAHESHDRSKTLPEAAQGDVPVPDQGVPKKKGGGPALEHANLDQEVHQAVYRYLRRCEGFSEAFRRQFHTFSVHPIAVERLERKLSLICRERRRRELKELSELSGTEDEQLVQSIPNSWRQVRLHSGHILSQIVARRKECFEKATQEVTTAAEMAAAAAAASIEKRKKKSKTVSHHRKEEEVDTDARHTFDSSLRRSFDNTVKNTQQNGDDTLHVGGRTDNVPSPNVRKVGCDVKTRSPQSHETQPPLVPHATPPFPDSESTCDERPTREFAAPLLPRASPQLELPEASNRKSRSSMEVRGATPPPHERKAVRSPPLSVHPLHPIQPPWMNSPISNNTKHSSVRSKHGENVPDNTDRKEPAVPKGDVREQGHPGSGRRSRKSQQLSSDEEGEAESEVVGVSETKREPNQNTPLWPVTPSQSSRLKNPQTNLSTSRHRTTSKKEITHSLSSDDDTENDPMQGRGVAEKLFETPTAQKSKPSTHQSSKKHNSSVGVENTTTPTPVTRLLRSHTAAAASTALKKRQFSSDEEEDVIPVKSTTDHRSKRTRQL